MQTFTMYTWIMTCFVQYSEWQSSTNCQSWQWERHDTIVNALLRDVGRNCMIIPYSVQWINASLTHGRNLRGEIGFYAAAALLAMQSAVIATAITSVYLSVCPSVHPSVTRWYFIQTNEDRITRSSLWGSKNTLVIWHQQWLGATSPST